MLGYGLTEQEALDVYEANKFAVENSGYDYAVHGISNYRKKETQ